MTGGLCLTLFPLPFPHSFQSHLSHRIPFPGPYPPLTEISSPKILCAHGPFFHSPTECLPSLLDFSYTGGPLGQKALIHFWISLPSRTQRWWKRPEQSVRIREEPQCKLSGTRSHLFVPISCCGCDWRLGTNQALVELTNSLPGWAPPKFLSFAIFWTIISFILSFNQHTSFSFKSMF